MTPEQAIYCLQRDRTRIERTIRIKTDDIERLNVKLAQIDEQIKTYETER